MRATLALEIRLPLGSTVKDLEDLRESIRHLRARLAPLEWAALERLALAVAAESALDLSTAEALLRVQLQGKPLW